MHKHHLKEPSTMNLIFGSLSEQDISQHVLSIALNKIVQKLNINTNFEIPYLADYSVDAKTLYIDKRI